MSAVERQRCFNHAFREAVAKCPTCTRFFCRECITEHDDRMICATCLNEQLDAGKQRRVSAAWLPRVGQVVAGWVIIWMAFYFLGQVLLETPTNLHEGTLWQEDWFGIQ